MKDHADDMAADVDTVEEQFPRMLSAKEKISYAMGDVGNAILFDVGQLYLLKYLTDALRLPALMAGSVFLVAKIWDAFADVAVGTWIDNQKKISKKGKFRPFILYAALPLALLSIANFSVPNFSVTVQELWAYIFYMIFGTVYSISNIAYGSMQPTMTRNSVERAELASYRNIGANVGGLFANVLFIPLVLMFPTQRIGYAVVVIIFAIFEACCQLICYKNIKENYTEPIKVAEKKGIKEILGSYKALFHNGPLLILCFSSLANYSALNVKNAIQFYFGQYVLHDIKIISYMSFFTMGFAILAGFITPSLAKRYGKKNTYISGCVIWFFSDILGFFVIHDGITFAIFTSISLFGAGIINGLNWALLSDIVEFGEWKTHLRSEGVTYSAFTYFRKLSQAAAGIIPGIVLTMVGYIPNHAQSATALFGIRGLVFLYPAVMLVLNILLMVIYPLTERKYAQIMTDLQARHAAK